MPDLLVGFFMHSLYSTATGVVHVLEGGVPRKSFSRRTGNTGNARHTFRRTFAGEMFFKDASVIVFFLVHRSIDGETLGSMCHLFVRDGLGCHGFQRINPAIAHTVTEVFLLTPYHAFGQHIGKGFADYFLFDDVSKTHLGFGIQTHGCIQKFFVQERHTSFHSPCGQ